ncbi:unnamed protein product [Paramecium pentaurelia]|uniref:Uncharacterized protein n=1 Tax=Paramecium pentaurelia TaxID=43138 RepID=A0A8S1U863_9CILI|nr:unnamed protein product [Paramecium pentaurelia]
MNQSIFLFKKEKYREALRKQRNENEFRISRFLPNFCQKGKISSILFSFHTSIEQSSKMILNNDELMMKVYKNQQNKNALLLLSNISASESSNSVDRLIKEQYLHLKFLEIIQSKQSNIYQLQYACEGLTNLLNSKINIQQELTDLLNQDLITSIIKLREQIDENQLIDKDSMLYLCLSILIKIQSYQLQNYVSKPQLIDLFIMNINWFEKNIQVSCENIILICSDIEGLVDLIDDQKINSIIDCAINSLQNRQFDITYWILTALNTLVDFSYCDQKILGIVKNSKIITLLKIIFERIQEQQMFLIEVGLEFIYKTLQFQSLEIRFCFLKFLKDIQNLIEFKVQSSLLVLCSFILVILCEQLDQEESGNIISLQFEILLHLNEQQLTDEVIETLINIWNLLDQNIYKLIRKQKVLLEILAESKNESVSQLAINMMAIQNSIS